MDKPLKSLTHGQCDARPTVTSPAAGHHCHLTGTRWCCLVSEARVWKICRRFLPESAKPEWNPRPSELQVQCPNTLNVLWLPIWRRKLYMFHHQATLLVQNPTILNWSCRLTQIDLYSGHKATVYLCVIDRFLSQQTAGTFGFFTLLHSFFFAKSTCWLS